METEKPVNLLSLPAYPEMILAAIEALNGSNKTSISNYIESNYLHLPAEHSALLSHHLDQMKQTGLIHFWRNNYIKPNPDAPTRRGRGRPAKPKDIATTDVTNLAPAMTKVRPAKDPNAPPKPEKSKIGTATATGKLRGRPRKIAKPSEAIGGGDNGAATAGVMMATGSGKPRGRPPKVKHAVDEVSVEN